ncbi:hypothetical protein ODJ79_25560 [Actinoplanes sp. KI2]|uniref:hypothetical protein n=1 Tax=Actinoplanes sp. KI2 TaxID=2983315 RepID=UPI0021D5AE47|nr:hypothetical protein [Actinoplanes sp. KI2]MCU7727109.1 hypothetical protein [Actinoplanes sp. KI2]
MSEETDGVWRDESSLPLSELTKAMASYSQDGQVDDLTGEDAGAEDEYGHGARARPSDGDSAVGDPEATSAEGRGLRPSPDGASPYGRTGPN